MSFGDFVHLHVHYETSPLDGINRLDQLPYFVRDELGQKALAITDHGNLSGTYKFFKTCREAGVKPILGIEAYYSSIDRTIKDVDDDSEKYYHLILLAQNATGFKNLIQLSSRAYIEGFYHKPRMDDALLAEYSEGIIATSACLGSRTSQLILKGKRAEAIKLLEHHAEMFKHRFFLELQLHRDPEQQLVNKELLYIADRLNLPLLLTNDSHYTHIHDKQLHEQTLCMQTNDTMSNPNRFSFGDIQVHMADHDWMWERAKEQGIPYDAISNTLSVAAMVDDSGYFADIKNRYPTFKGKPEGIPSWLALERLAKSELARRMGGSPPENYRERLDHELKVIKRMGFSDYILIVWEIVENAKKLGVMVGPGRGSAAGSLVCYALGITQLDPIKYNLLFSRFLNEGRAARPLIFDEKMRGLIKQQLG